MTDLAALLAKLRVLPTQQVLVPPERASFLASRVPGLKGGVTQDCVVVPSGVMGLLLDVVSATDRLVTAVRPAEGDPDLEFWDAVGEALERLAETEVGP